MFILEDANLLGELKKIFRLRKTIAYYKCSNSSHCVLPFCPSISADFLSQLSIITESCESIMLTFLIPN